MAAPLSGWITGNGRQGKVRSDSEGNPDC